MHALLRQRTARLHAHLDTVPLLAGLLSPTLTLEHYLRVLEGFHAFLPPHEALLAHAPWAPSLASRVPDLARRWRAPLLEADILHVRGLLAARAPEAAPMVRRALPPPPTLTLHSLDEAFGLLYVLEGSTLGGTVIAARVQASLGLAQDSGLSYFSGRGDWTREAWKGFLDALSCFHEESSEGAVREARAAAIVAKACEAFEALTSFFRALGDGEVSSGETGEEPDAKDLRGPARP